METEHFSIDNPATQAVSTQATAAYEAVEQCVSEHPQSSLLVGAAAGFVIGFAIGAQLERPGGSNRSATGLADALGKRFLDSIDSLASSSMETIRDTLGR